MRYVLFAPERSDNKYPVAVLSKALHDKLGLTQYVQGMEGEAIAYALPNQKVLNKKDIEPYLAQLLPTLCNLRVDYIVVTDANVFKHMTKAKRVDRIAGYVVPCTLENFEHFWVMYAPPTSAAMYDANAKQKIRQTRDALRNHRAGIYEPPGIDIIHASHYPETPEEIRAWLRKLVDTDLTCDVETYGLKHYSCGLASMTLCWSQHEGIAFTIDKDRDPADAQYIRMLLKEFFEARAIRNTAKTLYHRSWFDVYVLTYQLFMADTLDHEGMLYGLDTLLTNFEDTQLVRYLATNSCSGNKLSLKDAAQEFCGNYAIDVEDAHSVPKKQLLEYNLIDGLGTWYVWNKHWPDVVRDQQVGIYEDHFKPWLKDIIQMQLTGLPLNMKEVAKGKAEMEADAQAALAIVMASPFVAQLEAMRANVWAIERNAVLKKKRVTPADCPAKDRDFNIGSGMQLGMLLHQVMNLPVLELTDEGEPKTGMKAIKALKHHTTDPAVHVVLDALVAYKQVDKILTSFIPAFEAAHLAPDGWHYVYGYFNLAGTLSGRLSSQDPNLQNLPASGSKYRKTIKKMIQAPPGKLFVGLDFASLEDRISALTTKDPNKLKVYTDGYDGHSLRAYYYYRAQMPDIDPTIVASINAIADKYPDLRSKSKGPTFALTYQGTINTLIAQGFSRDEAVMIYDAYHGLYAVSDQWVQDRLAQAAKDGYVTVAFGLRLRTPAMARSVMNIRGTPYAATAEGRSAGNAMGQSYCMLNSRAWCGFNKLVRAHPEYRTKIRPCAQIHDAGYAIVDNDPDLLAWMNIHLVKEVQWQELPEIQHPTVKLGGELSVFYPTWADELTIPNGADADQILQLAKAHAA